MKQINIKRLLSYHKEAIELSEYNRYLILFSFRDRDMKGNLIPEAQQTYQTLKKKVEEVIKCFYCMVVLK